MLPNVVLVNTNISIAEHQTLADKWKIAFFASKYITSICFSFSLKPCDEHVIQVSQFTAQTQMQKQPSGIESLVCLQRAHTNDPQTVREVA